MGWGVVMVLIALAVGGYVGYSIGDSLQEGDTVAKPIEEIIGVKKMKKSSKGRSRSRRKSKSKVKKDRKKSKSRSSKRKSRSRLSKRKKAKKLAASKIPETPQTAQQQQQLPQTELEVLMVDKNAFPTSIQAQPEQQIIPPQQKMQAE